jgi:aspartate/methionine/tyrosine aminotransferase
MVALSPTLFINERVQEMRAAGRSICHFGFGEAPFPAPERLVEALRRHADAKAYLPVAGLPALREAVLEHQARHTGTDPDAFDVMIAPGSKLLLYAAQMAIEGDILLPVPSWVSYAPQAELLGQASVPVPVSLTDEGYGLSADDLTKAVADAKAAGKNPTKLLINFPNNPAGLMISDQNLREISAWCGANNAAVISDEIYGRVSYDGTYRSMAAIDTERTLVTSGLSKHLSLGGWRLGIMLVPKAMDGLFKQLCEIASETWSCVTAPVQNAAVEAYAGHDDVETFISDQCAIHSAVNGMVASRLRAAGVDCPTPQGGFYTFPDFASVFGARFSSGLDLAQSLLDEEGIASLPGSAFGEDDTSLRLRLAACDYDGGAAMKRWRDGVNDPAVLAPNVAEGIDRFERFITKRRV